MLSFIFFLFYNYYGERDMKRGKGETIRIIIWTTLAGISLFLGIFGMLQNL